MHPLKKFSPVLLLVLFGLVIFPTIVCADTAFVNDAPSFRPVTGTGFSVPAGQPAAANSAFVVMPGIQIGIDQSMDLNVLNPTDEIAVHPVQPNTEFAPTIPSTPTSVIETVTGFTPMPSFSALSILPPKDIVPESDQAPIPVPALVPAAPISPSVELDVVDANNRFALDLYTKLSQDPDNTGNSVFFSPFSISSALAIVYEGARGATADEIQSVFHFPKDDAARRAGFAGIISGINSGDADYTLSTANALWAEQTYRFLPAYINTAEQYYSARVTNLDFKNNTEASRLTINNWVEDQTNDRIRDLVPSGALDSSTRLVITNAVYFKGTWVTQFDKTQTRQDIFTVSPWTTASVQMMQMTGESAVFPYKEADLFQALEMPYAHESGKQLSMLVILPKGNNLATVESSLGTLNLPALRESLRSERVDVYFPKFRLETTYNLPDTLASMGMPIAFTDSADFSGMDGTHNLTISDVIHKAFIDVNEEGTEAAAATAVEMRATGMISRPAPIPIFRADHPFLFMIVDDETGSILFMGRVMNPSN